MAKLVILTLELKEAQALLYAAEQRQKQQEPNQFHGVTQVAVNKLDKAVKRAAVNERGIA